MDRVTVFMQSNTKSEGALLRITYSYIADKIKEQYGEIMAYHNLMHAVELTSKVTTGNFSHYITTIKGLYRNCIDFINEYGLE